MTANSADDVKSYQEYAPRLAMLCEELSRCADQTDLNRTWPLGQLTRCRDAGVFRWFIDSQYGGFGWSDAEITNSLISLASSCLTTTFVLTQWHAACRRIAASHNLAIKQNWLPKLASGEVFTTVGISHLTTSRQHCSTPPLIAKHATPNEPENGWLLTGYSPWVTGAAHADLLVLGAVTETGEQLLCAVPGERAGVRANPGQQLLALTSSCTDKVELSDVKLENDEIIAGPATQVLQGSAGGLQTSALAIGLTQAAVTFLGEEAAKRPDLKMIAESLRLELEQLRNGLTASLGNALNGGELRTRANSLVLRSTQAALGAAKGAGFTAGHPVGRWAREALFFLVWSCPQPVLSANLCELAQIAN